MTVKELINILSKYSNDTEVLLYLNEFSVLDKLEQIRDAKEYIHDKYVLDEFKDKKTIVLL